MKCRWSLSYDWVTYLIGSTRAKEFEESKIERSVMELQLGNYLKRNGRGFISRPLVVVRIPTCRRRGQSREELRAESVELSDLSADDDAVVVGQLRVHLVSTKLAAVASRKSVPRAASLAGRVLVFKLKTF